MSIFFVFILKEDKPILCGISIILMNKNTFNTNIMNSPLMRMLLSN